MRMTMMMMIFGGDSLKCLELTTNQRPREGQSGKKAVSGMICRSSTLSIRIASGMPSTFGPSSMGTVYGTSIYSRQKHPSTSAGLSSPARRTMIGTGLLLDSLVEMWTMEPFETVQLKLWDCEPPRKVKANLDTTELYGTTNKIYQLLYSLSPTKYRYLTYFNMNHTPSILPAVSPHSPSISPKA